MLFNDNLEEIIFHKHELIDTDELIIISGYIGPSPIKRLATLPFNCTVIYGMYGSDSISKRLHNTLVDILANSQNIKLYYSKLPVHSKCYIWRQNGQIVSSLIGSANFSKNGLTIPYKESLADVTFDSFKALGVYYDQILSNSLSYDSDNIKLKCANSLKSTSTNSSIASISPDSCTMTLLDPHTNEVPEKSGLNWQNSNAHVSQDDAYIAIRKDYIRNYPNIFPPKQSSATSLGNGRLQRQNDSVEFIWDDGTVMEGLFEGSQDIDNITYPKNLCSSRKKNELGVYIKQRLNLPKGSNISKNDLDRYGRTNIEITLLQEGVYYLDFSVTKKA